MAGVHGGGVASERSSFVGTRVPDEISKMVKTLNSVTVDKPTFRAIVAGMHGISYSLPRQFRFRNGGCVYFCTELFYDITWYQLR